MRKIQSKKSRFLGRIVIMGMILLILGIASGRWLRNRAMAVSAT